MAREIKVDYTAVNDAVVKINEAIKTYNSLAKKGFDDSLSALDGMNSDYVDTIQNVLDCLNPKVKEKMDNSMSNYSKKTSSAAKTFKVTDDDLAKSYKGEQ
ncbi:MAG: hypothetical protein K6D38_04060 [Pseudobutyrivibrio sp.]|nr:hypothetical protein [Pseudobutyrivibrio sp.]